MQILIYFEHICAEQYTKHIVSLFFLLRRQVTLLVKGIIENTEICVCVNVYVLCLRPECNNSNIPYQVTGWKFFIVTKSYDMFHNVEARSIRVVYIPLLSLIQMLKIGVHILTLSEL